MYKQALLCLLPALVAAGPGINPNPNPNFNPSTSNGTFGPFVIPQKPAANATGGPAIGSIDARVIQAMQLAISNWQTDTGIVSLFLNNGPTTMDEAQFKGIADGAFKAEVDELTQKAVLDQVIGNDPRVSLANLTLTNGVFQSVVDNLQIMSIQGRSRMNLISVINNVRCTQILPSIDTYMIVAAEYIGNNAQQRRAVRPNACAQILAGASPSAFAALPGTPAGTPPGIGDGNIPGVPGACGQGNVLGMVANTTTSAASNVTVTGPTLSANTTTPELGLPGFPSSSRACSASVTSASAAAASSNSGKATTSKSGQKGYGGDYLSGRYGNYLRV
ncbi:uncharacterized protein PV09_06601 [Verruconis gallopava]|uniref:Uncharacterized protein n=1 Tax=Verruconis gallopava TaxID=253628 RepID=A0A0D2A6C4_9PEZI|nr:uncharacterized protein PV09_06601 [Verruconis gallopava]KIW02110.1 hypothetical protein PV09_06601 [Verruconis gallopava]